MFLRVLLVLSFIVSLGFSVELIPYRYDGVKYSGEGTYRDGNIAVRIEYKGEEKLNRKDWVAIYKKGASTAWKNVLVWSWVHDLRGLAPMDYTGHMFSRKKLSVGTYVFRFFKNNSYTVDKSLEFTIKKTNSFLEEVDASFFYNNNKKNFLVKLYGIDSKVFKPNQNDWLAIYKRGSSNVWKNVIKWTWARDVIKNDNRWVIKNLNLSQGKYEVRYFLNNSYKVDDKSDYFSFVKDNSMAKLDDLTLEYRQNQVVSVRFYDTSANKKDWIAIFKKGAKKINKNIICKKYNLYGKKDGFVSCYKNLKPGEYEAVLFANDSFKMIATSNIVIKRNKEVFIRVVKKNYSRIAIDIRNYSDAKKKDWIAIFKQGKAHTRGNILAWSYTNSKTHIDFKNFRDGKKYSAVLFSNNTYNKIDSFNFEF